MKGKINMENLFNNVKDAIKNDFKILKKQLGVYEQEKVQQKVKREAKDPIDVLNKYIRESEAEVKNALVLVERQKMLAEEFSNELQQTENEINKRKEQVSIATKAGADEMAQKALELQAVLEVRKEKIQKGYEMALEQLNELEHKHEEMQNKIKDLHIKRLELMGKENVLTMKEKMNQILKETEFGEGYIKYETLKNEMNEQEKVVDETYNMTVFDAKIQELAKQMNAEHKKDLDDSM